MSHKYSDDCTCDKCAATWRKALFAAVDRCEKKVKDKKKKKK